MLGDWTGTAIMLNDLSERLISRVLGDCGLVECWVPSTSIAHEQNQFTTVQELELENFAIVHGQGGDGCGDVAADSVHNRNGCTEEVDCKSISLGRSCPSRYMTYILGHCPLGQRQ